jgi:hypothetical protein
MGCLLQRTSKNLLFKYFIDGATRSSRSVSRWKVACGSCSWTSRVWSPPGSATCSTRMTRATSQQPTPAAGRVHAGVVRQEHERPGQRRGDRAGVPDGQVQRDGVEDDGAEGGDHSAADHRRGDRRVRDEQAGQLRDHPAGEADVRRVGRVAGGRAVRALQHGVGNGTNVPVPQIRGRCRGW